MAVVRYAQDKRRHIQANGKHNTTRQPVQLSWQKDPSCKVAETIRLAWLPKVKSIGELRYLVTNTFLRGLLMKTYLLEEMTWPEIREAMETGYRTVIIAAALLNTAPILPYSQTLPSGKHRL